MNRIGRRPWLLFLALLVAGTSLSATPAQADLKHHKRFVFRGKINHRDPVNLLWFGGSANDPLCAGVKDTFCMNSSFRYWDHMSTRFCNGGNDGRLRMHKTGGGPLINPSNDSEVSGSRTCKKQYHARNWDDTDHGHGTHVWGLSPIHHENRCWHCGGHKIDRSWEIAEYDAMTNLGRSGKFCTYRDWRALPGSGGKIKGWYSDGWITRISWHRYAGSATCSGA
ncbi:MAG: hypothetical protein QOH76_788 [Thermoleophilaceae bacterium]|jgi:hypothetical protein|nr:hypothetical protein [Thermoleophilaceae bacterium]